MTERRRLAHGWERWAERQIREAQARGEFSNLTGSGRPLPGIDDARDELWWVKKLMRREGLSITPPTLAIRKAREDLLDSVANYQSEAQLRAAVQSLNTRIRAINAKGGSGPPSTVMPLDPDRVVAVWRQGQS